MSEQPTIRIADALGGPRKIALQALFWCVGLGLLGWIVYRAYEYGDWSRLWHAKPLHIFMLIGCTVLSWVLNGATFWITIQPLRRVRMYDMLMLNLVGNMLNYAPIRAGAIARVLYHHRVDRLELLQIGAWFAMIGYVLLLGIASCVVAWLVRGDFDPIWAALVLGQIALGALATRALAGHPLVMKHGRGIGRLLRDHRALWGAAVLRVIDIAAFTGRMFAALLILEITLPTEHVIVLAMVALASSLIPFGRVGFREFCVAVVAARLGAMESVGDVPWEQLALVESAGEAIFYVPAGIFALRWYRRKWRAAASLIEPADLREN